MPYSKDLFMIKPDNVFLANSMRFVGKLLGPQARDGTSVLMRSLILECVEGYRWYILHDIRYGRKSLYDLFALGIFSSRTFQRKRNKYQMIRLMKPIKSGYS